MSLLVTGADGRLARHLLAGLASLGPMRATDLRFTAPLPAGIERVEGDLRDAAFAGLVVSGIEAILHLAPLAPPAAGESEILDHAARGTYRLVKAASDAGARRMVIGSTLDMFDRIPDGWRVDHRWRPRPQPRIDHLGPWIAELSARECSRELPVSVRCVRFGRLPDDEREASGTIRRTTAEAALDALRKLLDADDRGWESRWRIVHVGSTHEAGEEQAEIAIEGSAGEAWRSVLAPVAPIRSRPIRSVVLFGAGGPLGAAAARELSSSYTLRLTDRRPIAEIAAEARPQSPGAPLPEPLGAPHECRVVDVTDPDAVMAACEGMDAIVNGSVLREDPVEAFRVNLLGAYQIARAAAAHGIRRVVHTGPQMVTVARGIGYGWDYDVESDAPPRPGTNLYIHTKYLGQEACRVFADAYGLEVPVLLFNTFLDPEASGRADPFSVSWNDAARAIRRALEVRALPSPYELFNIVTDLPHGQFSSRKAKDLLDWEPRDTLERFWKSGH